MLLWAGNRGEKVLKIMADSQTTFGSRLIEIRKKKGKSGPQIARKLNISYNTYHKYEIGTIPPFERMIEIIKILGVSCDYFFAPFIKIKDEKLLVIIEKVKWIYELPGGKEQLPIELYKLEVFLKEQLKEKPGQSLVKYLEL